MRDVRNWDDLVDRVAPVGDEELALAWRECVLDVLVEMFPQLTRNEVEVSECEVAEREKARKERE